MCEANVYLLDEFGKEQLVLESVDKLIPCEDGIMMESIYSERKMLKAEIKEMALLEHKIILAEI